MTRPSLGAAAACLAVLLVACGSPPATRALPGNGPLGGSSGPPGSNGGICWDPRPGSVLTAGMYVISNSSRSPVTLTRAWLTGARGLTVDAVYADVLWPGDGALGDKSGYPPAHLRHAVAGVKVPGHAYAEILFTVTSGRRPLATGEKVAYQTGGLSYTSAHQWFLGMMPGALCRVKK